MIRRTQERKTNRKSRLKRLPTSSGGRDTASFKPSAEDWQRIADAYGQPLSVEDQAYITAVVDSYLHWQQFEPNAPFAEDALKHLNHIVKYAHPFLTTLLTTSDDQTNEAAAYAESLISSSMADKLSPETDYIAELDASPNGFVVWKHAGDSPPRTNKLDELRDLLTNLLAACKAVRAQLSEDDQAAFEEGQAWQLMVRKLVLWARQRGFPATASKGRSKKASINPPPSPFVAFVRELQKTFPAEKYQRHMHSDDALSKAIADVLADMKRQDTTAGA
jgi:hypothetical protein